MISFICVPEAVPMVESLLAAHGYRVHAPARKGAGGTITILMTDGSAAAVLIHCANEVAAINIWGRAQASAARLLKCLPFELRQRPCTYGDKDAPTTAARQTSTGEYVWRSGGNDRRRSREGAAGIGVRRR